MSELFAISEADYGDKYKGHLFEQYKLYVDSAQKNSDRRQNANNYFITISAAIFSIIGLTFKGEDIVDVQWIKVILSVVGIAISVIYWFLIRSYRQLNSGKFQVIHEIEKNLPLTIYEYEWKILGEGKDGKKYYPFSHVQQFVPWVLGTIYFFIIIVTVA